MTETTDFLTSISEMEAALAGDSTSVVVHRVAVHQPPVFDAPAIQRLRQDLNVTQGVLAHLLAVSPRIVESWETGRTMPSGPSRRLLEIIVKDPNVVNLLQD